MSNKRDEYYPFNKEDLTSREEGKDCFGKICYCLVCGHDDGWCIDHDQGPCLPCNGNEEDRMTKGFCDPPEESVIPTESLE